jgi:hypothetical protein
MSRPSRDDGSLYELTIMGSIGPVFRSALTPAGVSRSEVCTILRAGHASGRDLVDLLLLIQEKGLTVEGAFAIER